MAPSFYLAAAALISGVLSRDGVVIDTENLASALFTVATVLGPLGIMLRQYVTGRATWLGTRPKA